MKVMFVTLSLSGGGAERVVAVLSSGISKVNNYEAHVIVFKKKEKEYKLNDNVICYRMPQNAYSNKFKRINYIRHIIRNVNPDVVIPFLPEPTIYTYLATRFIDVSFISTVRNNPEVYGHNIKSVINNWITTHSDKCMLQTNAQRDFFKWKNNEQCFVIPNPVNDEMFHFVHSDRKKVEKFINCGRLIKQKNQRMMISAFVHAHSIHPEISLFIYGEGEERENLIKQLDELKAGKFIHLMGRTENVSEVLDSADAFLLTSDYEGMPNALMEAMAIGLPCISTDCPTGPNDLINDKYDGLLTEVGNSEDLSSKICFLIENPGLANEIGNNAKQKMLKNYTLDAILTSFLKVIEGN